MRRRLFFVLGFASVMGLLTAFLVYRVITQAVTPDPRDQATEEVVVAAVNIAVGESVTSRHVKLASWPKNAVPESAATSLDDVEGQVVWRSIVAGEPLLESKLLDAKLAARGGLLPMLVPEGLRGVTIKVDDAVRESGFVQPNSHVDVLVSMARERGSQGRIAKIILQNVPVIAAGQIVEMQDNKPVNVTTVTLALTAEQAERLALAQTEGRLMLATRNVRDDRVLQTLGVTRATLLGAAPSTPQEKPTDVRVGNGALLPTPTADTHTVSVLRAGKVTDYTFVHEGGESWVAVDR